MTSYPLKPVIKFQSKYPERKSYIELSHGPDTCTPLACPQPVGKSNPLTEKFKNASLI